MDAEPLLVFAVIFFGVVVGIIAIASVVVIQHLGAGWRAWTAARWRMLRMSTAARWWRLRMWWLGGVRTLDQALRFRCFFCRQTMEAGAVVRELSCRHVFHEACGIERWLRENNMACFVCRRTARRVTRRS